MNMEKKFTTKRQAEYIELHRNITENGFRFSGYFYTGDLGGICECGKVGLAHNFVLTNQDGDELILGSSCINKSEVYGYIFDNMPGMWDLLQKELKLYKHLFRHIRSGDMASEAVTLEQLRELSKTIKNEWDTENDRRKQQAKEALPVIEAYHAATKNGFLKSVMEQAKSGRRGLSDRQIEVTESIIDKYNEAHGTTEEDVLASIEDNKVKGCFEDDFMDVAHVLRLGKFDRDTKDWLMDGIDRYGSFNDSAYAKACTMLYKYRKQLNVRFWEIANLPEEYRLAGDLLYVKAFNNLVKFEIIPMMNREAVQ